MHSRLTFVGKGCVRAEPTKVNSFLKGGGEKIELGVVTIQKEGSWQCVGGRRSKGRMAVFRAYAKL